MDETQAPGCYGSALTYDMGSAECSQCMFAAQCGPKSEARMRYLREALKLPEPKPKKTPSSAAPLPIGSNELTVPKKVQHLLDRIEAAGIRVTEKLAAGQNPFKTPRFLAVACQALLHKKGDGVTMALLTELLERHLEWTKGTASAHAIQARQVLLHLGAITYENGLMRLK